MQYQLPLNDLKFLLFDVLNVDGLAELELYADASPDIIVAILEEMGRFAADVIQPTNRTGDEQGCSYDAQSHDVTTPDGFRDAYRQFAEGGWTALDAPP